MIGGEDEAQEEEEEQWGREPMELEELLQKVADQLMDGSDQSFLSWRNLKRVWR